MQYEVHPTNQTQEIDPKLKGSFKNFYVSYEKKKRLKSTKIFPDMRFSRGVQGKSEFSF